MSHTAEVVGAVVIGMIAHELAHALAAVVEGDPTPLEFKRIGIEPWKHLDVIGSFIVPAVTVLLFGAIIGWCKPVPVTRDLMADRHYSWLRVSIAGPAANFLVALVFLVAGLPAGAAANIMVGLFNLLPFPGFDGGKIVRTLFLEG